MITNPSQQIPALISKFNMEITDAQNNHTTLWAYVNDCLGFCRDVVETLDLAECRLYYGIQNCEDILRMLDGFLVKGSLNKMHARLQSLKDETTQVMSQLKHPSN